MNTERAPFADHRARLLAALPEGEAVLLFGSSLRARNADNDYRFRQHSDVLYLTGWEDPDVAVLLRKGAAPNFVMFVQPKAPDLEVWTGVRPGPEGAVADYGADQAWSIDDLDKELPDLLLGCRALHYRFAEDAARDRQVSRALAAARKKSRRETWQPVPDAIIDPERLLHELRLFKSEAELSLLRRAAAITAEAHLAAMAMTAPGVPEYALEAEIEHIFRRRGGDGPGYPSIVGGGVNATILHYHANRDPLAAGTVVCVDAGCEYGWYTADVTRSWPVSGRFSEAQRAVYRAVLDVQKAVIEAVKPGVTWRELTDLAVRLLTEQLVALGLLQGEVDALIENKDYKRFYMHGIGHWLGLDVHDAGAYQRDGASRALEPGMVITVEPGLYIPVADDIPEGFRGVGVRIEDDVLVTADGHEVLTAAIPKEVDEVEAAVGHRLAAR